MYWGFILICLRFHIFTFHFPVFISLWVLYNFILGVSGSRAAFLRFLFLPYLNINSIIIISSVYQSPISCTTTLLIKEAASWQKDDDFVT